MHKLDADPVTPALDLLKPTNKAVNPPTQYEYHIYVQEDAAQYLEHLITWLVQAGMENIVEMTITAESNNCNRHNNVFSEHIVRLPINSSEPRSLQETIDDYFVQVKCPCTDTTCVQTKSCTAPELLLLQLPTVEWCSESKQSKKLEYPVSLAMQCSFQCQSYELTALIKHTGSNISGHYVAYIKVLYIYFHSSLYSLHSLRSLTHSSATHTGA